MNIGFYRFSLLNRGGDRIVVEYANHLAESGHLVTFHVRQINTVFAISPNIHVHRIPYPVKAGCLLYGATHHLDHDIVIVDIIHLPLLLSFRNNVIYFAQADDIEYYDNPVIRKIIDTLYRTYFLRGEPIITVSEALSSIFSKRYKFNNSYVVTNGIDLAAFYPEPENSLINLKEKRRAVFFMDRGDHHRKGYDVAVSVLKLLRKDIAAKMELWVCGNKHEGEKYSFPVRNFGVVSDSRLRQILSSADIFFYPSRHEGFGLFPLEAMACGCAVVTTDAIPYARSTSGIMTSPIENGEDLSNNLTVLISDETLLKQKQEQGKEAARAYDMEKSKIAFSKTLVEIAAGKSLCA